MAGLDSFTKLLLHCDGADASTTFTDASAAAHAVTANGNAQIDTAQFKFNGAACLLDGTGDYLSVASHADFGFGTGDFTIDFWVRWASTAGQQNIFSFAGSAGPVPAIYKPAGGATLRFYNGGDQITTTTGSIIDTWEHVALARSGTSTKMFINGTQEGATFSDSTNYAQDGVRIGAHVDGTLAMNGWFDEVRISKGIARWTANFTPPDRAYGNSLPIFLRPPRFFTRKT